MSPSNPKPSAKPRLVTTTGVEVLVHGREHEAPVESEAPPDPLPDAIVFPPGQSIAERNAFLEELERQWGKLISSMLRREDVNEASARDLHQRALVVLLQQYDKLKGPREKVVRFVETVVTHEILNHLRRPRPVLGADVDAEATSLPDPERAAERRELWRKIEGYMDELSREEREVLEARELDGMTFEVIATAVKRPVRTVKNQHARAMTKVQELARASERRAQMRAQRPGPARGGSGPAADRKSKGSRK